MQWKHAQGFVPDSTITSEIHGAFVTSYGRLRLLEVIEKLGKRCLYFDTDSCVFVAREGDYMPELGDGLGELTSELDAHDWIVSFLTAGPKQYAYVTAQGKEVCKIRGFTLNHATSQHLHFHALKDMITGVHPQRNPTQINPTKICRNFHDMTIVSKPEGKKYSTVYTKRAVVDGYNTLPYGY